MNALKILHLCLFTAEFLCGSAYVLFRLLQVISKKWLRKTVIGTVGFMSLFFIFVLFLRSRNTGAWYLPLQAVEYTWVVLMFYLLITVLSLDGIRLILYLFKKGRVWSRENMLKVRRVWYSLGGVIAILLIAYGFHHFKHPVVKTVTMEVNKPVPDWKIVVASDLHLGTMPASVLQQNIQTINNLNPDIIFLLGDQFIIDWHDLGKMGYADALEKLKAKKGIYLINGNHEYYHGYPHTQDPEYKKLMEEWNFTVLEDSVVNIENQLVIIGRDDTTNRKRIPLEALMAEVPPGLPVIVLDHNPSGMAAAQRCGADIQLSGHTHNGQLFPLSLWGRFTSSLKDVLYYGYEKRGGTQYYVTSGLGSSGAPVRIGTDAEIVVVEMK